MECFHWSAVSDIADGAKPSKLSMLTAISSETWLTGPPKLI